MQQQSWEQHNPVVLGMFSNVFMFIHQDVMGKYMLIFSEAAREIPNPEHDALLRFWTACLWSFYMSSLKQTSLTVLILLCPRDELFSPTCGAVVEWWRCWTLKSHSGVPKTQKLRSPLLRLENLVLWQVLSFMKPGSRLEYSHTCFTCCQEFCLT